MIREKLIDKRVGDDRKFRWRSHDVSRIEGLSDAVFGFAVTLLVVSLEVPKTFAELMEAMRGFGAFAVSFALLIVVWYNQFKFFRRYGLQDNFTVVLNAVLLFVILFYVYPLKFVFTFLINLITGHREAIERMVQAEGQVTTLMLIFSIGYVAVFGLFVLLYGHAYRRRRQLDLNELEIFDTRADIREAALNVGIAAISIGFAVFARSAGLAGMTYMLCPVVLTMHGMTTGRQRRKLEERLGFHENTMFEPTA